MVGLDLFFVFSDFRPRSCSLRELAAFRLDLNVDWLERTEVFDPFESWEALREFGLLDLAERFEVLDVSRCLSFFFISFG